MKVIINWRLRKIILYHNTLNYRRQNNNNKMEIKRMLKPLLKNVTNEPLNSKIASSDTDISDDLKRGTKIILQLKEDLQEFLEKRKLKDLIRST